MPSRTWETLNDLEMTTAKIVSAREIIDAAVDAIQHHQNDKAETLMTAAYEFLEYYLNEFDEKFKLAWQETVVKQKEKEYYEPDPCMTPWGHSDLEYFSKHSGSTDDDKIIFKTDGEDRTPKWDSFWVKKDPVTGYNYQGSTVSSKYTDEELDAMCDAAEKEDKVKKWVLPVEECKDADTDETEYFIQFPDDLLEAANLTVGDQVEWVDKGDGSYLLKKVERTLNYDEAIAAGWTMTGDGFWIKE